MTKTMSLIVGTFLSCWMPTTIYFLYLASTKHRIPYAPFNPSLELIFVAISLIATHLNSAIDPLIYAYRMKEFRDAITRLIKI